MSGSNMAGMEASTSFVDNGFSGKLWILKLFDGRPAHAIGLGGAKGLEHSGVGSTSLRLDSIGEQCSLVESEVFVMR